MLSWHRSDTEPYLRNPLFAAGHQQHQSIGANPHPKAEWLPSDQPSLHQDGAGPARTPDANLIPSTLSMILPEEVNRQILEK
jgi:hypothetical protein